MHSYGYMDPGHLLSLVERASHRCPGRVNLAIDIDHGPYYATPAQAELD